MRPARESVLACAFVVATLTACQDKAAESKPNDKAAESKPSDKPAPVDSKNAEQPAPAEGTKADQPAAAAAAAAGEDYGPSLHNLGTWSEMYAYCGWKAEPFKDLRARLLAAPKLAGSQADFETYFDVGAKYGAREAKKRADQKAKGETPSAWACGADVEASVLKEIDTLLATE